MSNVVGTYNCDHCGKLVEGVRGVSGGVVTRDGLAKVVQGRVDARRKHTPPISRGRITS